MKYVGNLFTILILFVIQIVSAQAQTYTIDAYTDNENTGTTLHENRINLIFLADGWPENQTGTDNFHSPRWRAFVTRAYYDTQRPPFDRLMDRPLVE